MMEPPERLAVPTCIGCGAMSRLGACDVGCSEHKLELVRAAAYDSVAALSSDARGRTDAFRHVAEQLASQQPVGGEWEAAYRSLQQGARAALRAHPDRDGLTDWEEPVEVAITWWCAECGGIDAPQPCLGICVWRPVEWVRRSRYEQLREQTMSELEREQRLRHLMHRVAWITPRRGHWERGWRQLQAEARELLGAPATTT